MTRDQFITGESFRIQGPTYKGANTYVYDKECILKETRSSIDESLMYTDYHCNIVSIGRTRFTCFTYVMNKKVLVSYKFSDLIAFNNTL